MAICALVGFVAPFALAFWLVKKYKINLLPAAWGALVFIIFALGLESVVHQVVLNGPGGPAIIGNIWLYALYGAGMAALFEETGRFLAMKLLMKKEPLSAKPGIAYGLGHGGTEMAFLFGFGMISNAVIALMMNSGQMDAILASVPAEAMERAQAQLSGLQNITAGSLLYGLWERFSALILQISFSVIMWTAVRRGGKWLWLIAAAFFFHFLADGLAVVIAKKASMLAVEAVIFSLAIAVGAIAWKLAVSLNKCSEE